MTDATTSLEVIEYLDFEHQQPCEHADHANWHLPADPARMLIRSASPCCGSGPWDYFLCLSGWEDAANGLECRSCGRFAPREFFWTILRFLGGVA